MKKDFISESFRRRADSSAFFEAYVGARLSRFNLWTVHHPFTLADETGNPVSFYAHSWDLDVSSDNKLFTPVEVKSVNLLFHEPNDYPHLGLLVCSVASWQKKWPKQTKTQRDFIMVSRLSGGMVWLPKGTETWTKEVTDKRRKETYECVVAHKADLKPISAFATSILSHSDPWGPPAHPED